MSFGADSQVESGRIAEVLRARDVDVVSADEAATTGAVSLSVIAREAARLQRADCDGVVLLVNEIVGEDATPAYFAQAALHFGCPILLLGAFTPAFFEAAAALAEIGVPFDRFVLTAESLVEGADRIFAWLTENKKTARQPGIEAAQKLYGQTLALGGDGLIDSALWQRQFGVTVFRGGVDADADFFAPDGDANSALTAHLLRLISGGEPYVVSIIEPVPAETTLAQIARVRGKFVCLCLRRTATMGEMERHLIASRLWAIPGDYAAALRAACEALDMEFRFAVE